MQRSCLLKKYKAKGRKYWGAGTGRDACKVQYVEDLEHKA